MGKHPPAICLAAGVILVVIIFNKYILQFHQQVAVPAAQAFQVQAQRSAFSQAFAATLEFILVLHTTIYIGFQMLDVPGILPV